MHVSFFAFFEVHTFSVNMIALYLAFMSPQAVHDFMDRLHTRPPAAASADPPKPLTAWPMWAGVALAVVFLALVPFRAIMPNLFGTSDEPRDPIHPTSAPFVQLELRPMDDPEAPPLDWDALFDAREKEQKKRTPYPPRVRVIESERGIRSAVSKACSHVDKDLRLVQSARLATVDGWEELESPETDVCRRRPLATKRPRPSSTARPKTLPRPTPKQGADK